MILLAGIYDFGQMLVLFAIALPLAAFGAGLWLVWTGLERKPWWLLRLLGGAPMLVYGVTGIIFMTL